MSKKKLPDNLMKNYEHLSKFTVNEFIDLIRLSDDAEESAASYIRRLEEIQEGVVRLNLDIDIIPSILDKLYRAQAIIVMENKDPNVIHTEYDRRLDFVDYKDIIDRYKAVVVDRDKSNDTKGNIIH